MYNNQMLKFIKSASSQSSWLETNGEICFIGRSNVGKSSLINALANNQKIAITSKTPGRTMLVNYFQDQEVGITLVDLPGYGYAKASHKHMKEVSQMVGEYLTVNEKILMVYVLVDSQVGPTQLDIEMMNFLLQNNKRYTIVATKMDKANQSELHKTWLALDKFGAQAIFVSAAKNKNINKLKEHISAQFD